MTVRSVAPLTLPYCGVKDITGRPAVGHWNIRFPRVSVCASGAKTRPTGRRWSDTLHYDTNERSFIVRSLLNFNYQ